MNNALQKYLKDNNAKNMTLQEISALMAEKSISVKGAEGTPLLIFKYSDLGADFTDPVVKCSRGIILDKSRDFEAVCVPFDKFGNYAESYADDIDWKSARVQEKLDGSLIKLWYYEDKHRWVFSTNGTIFADDAHLTENSTFGDLIRKASNYSELYNELDILDKDFTYMFELISPENRIVIGYPETKLVHIGTRNNKTGQEITEDIGIERPAEYSVHTLDDAIKYANEICTPDERHEGFVVVDKDYHRIKVKNAFYLQAHYLMGKMNSAENIVKIIDAGDAGEILSYMPDMSELKRCLEIFEEFKKDVSDYCRVTKEIFFDNAPYPLTRELNKGYADVVLRGGQCPFPSIMFKFRDYYEKSERKGTVDGFISTLTCMDSYKVWKDHYEKALQLDNAIKNEDEEEDLSL